MTLELSNIDISHQYEFKHNRISKTQNSINREISSLKYCEIA